MSIESPGATPRSRGALRGATRLFNPLVLLLAGTRFLPLYGVIEHHGRRSGKTFRTPVVVRPTVRRLRRADALGRGHRLVPQRARGRRMRHPLERPRLPAGAARAHRRPGRGRS